MRTGMRLLVAILGGVALCTAQFDDAKDASIIKSVHDAPVPTQENDPAVGERRSLLGSLSRIKGFFSNSGCARWMEPNVAPLGDCQTALVSMGIDSQIRSFVRDDPSANCTAFICLPWRRDVNYCRVSLLFKDDVEPEDQVDTTNWLTIHGWSIYQLWKCTTFR